MSDSKHSIHIRKTTASISGFGGGYEDACQRMLWKGVAYLSEIQPPLSIWEKVGSYDGIYGILHTEGDGIKALEGAVMAGEDGVSGAMHQAVMGHLRAIHEHGVDWWVGHLRALDPARIFEWEGDLYLDDAAGQPAAGGAGS